MQATPANVDLDRIQAHLLKHDHITGVHDCHSWSMDGTYNVLTAHLVLDRSYDLKSQYAIKNEIKGLLKEENIHHMTIEFEMEGEECGFEDC